VKKTLSAGLLYDLIDPISAVTWLPRDERAFICLTGGIPRAG